jgi:hypothetical protein
MAAERRQGDEAEAAGLERSGAVWDRLRERIAHRVCRVEVRVRVGPPNIGLNGKFNRRVSLPIK